MPEARAAAIHPQYPQHQQPVIDSVAQPHLSSFPAAVDCLAASEHSMRSMTVAGEAFCAALRQRFPGSRVAASSVGRLPAEAEEPSVHSAHRHSS